MRTSVRHKMSPITDLSNDSLYSNHVGNHRWTSALEWTGQEAFNAESLEDWHVNKKVAGKMRAAEGLVFATIYGAGHMVPYDKPEESLAMVNRWLEGKDLDDPKP